VREGLVGEVVVEQSGDQRTAQRGQESRANAAEAIVLHRAQVPKADPPRRRQGGYECAQTEQSRLLGDEQVHARDAGGHVDVGRDAEANPQDRISLE